MNSSCVSLKLNLIPWVVSICHQITFCCVPFFYLLIVYLQFRLETTVDEQRKNKNLIQIRQNIISYYILLWQKLRSSNRVKTRDAPINFRFEKLQFFILLLISSIRSKHIVEHEAFVSNIWRRQIKWMLRFKSSFSSTRNQTIGIIII